MLLNAFVHISIPLLKQLELVSSTRKLHCGCIFPLFETIVHNLCFPLGACIVGYEKFHHHGGGRSSVPGLSKNKLEDGDGVLKVVKILHVLACLHQPPPNPHIAHEDNMKT
jgi:hypothetical protein